MLSFLDYTEQLDERLIMLQNGAKYNQVLILSGGGGCFDPDTLVETEHGLVKISEIKSGMKVYTFNEETNTKELKEVDGKKTFNVAADMLELTFDSGEKIVCTPDHEFWVDGKWVEAQFLNAHLDPPAKNSFV